VNFFKFSKVRAVHSEDDEDLTGNGPHAAPIKKLLDANGLKFNRMRQTLPASTVKAATVAGVSLYQPLFSVHCCAVWIISHATLITTLRLTFSCRAMADLVHPPSNSSRISASVRSLT
jgi:hypothetical protein